MNSDIQYFKIGIFVITALAIVVAGIVFLGSGNLFKEKMHAETYFDGSVQGLDIGSAVKYRGMKIGSVTRIQSAAAEYGKESRYIRVLFTIEDETIFGKTGADIKKSVENGLRAKLGLQGLTGAAYLETDFVEKGVVDDIEVPWTPETPYIPSVPSKIKRLGESLDHIMKNLEQINMQGITSDLNRLLQSMNRKITAVNTREMNQSLSLLIGELRDTNRKIASLVGAFDTDPILEHTLELVRNTNRIVKNAEAPLSVFLRDMVKAGAKMKQTAEDTRKVIHHIDSSFSSVGPALEKFEQTCTHADKALYFRNSDLKIILENLKTFSDNLAAMSESLEQNPSALIFSSPPQIEPKQKEER